MGFVIAMEAAEKSPNTIRTYTLAVATFLTWAQSDGTNWRSVNVLDLTRFKRHLQVTPSLRTGRLRAPSSVGIALTAVAEFLRYCAANGEIDPSVADRLTENRWIQPRGGPARGEGGQLRRARINALRVKLVEQPPQVLSDDQVAAMRAATRTARDRFLLRVRPSNRRGARTSHRGYSPLAGLPSRRVCCGGATLSRHTSNRQRELGSRQVQ